MGAKDSKPCCISYEEALKRVTDAEQKRIRDAFTRASNLNGIITRQAFIKEVLGEFVPIKLAEHIFQACGGTSKGINFKDLLCGLVLLTRGKKEEKIRFVFSLCANEAGTHVVKDDMVRLVQACDDGFVSEAVAECFIESDKVTYEEFREWLYRYEDSTSLTRWLLSEPSTVTLSNDVETPTFYQTLAGVTHLEERDIIDLEKRYWLLKTQSRTGKFDLVTLIPLISPPVPLPLCKGVFNAFDENQDGHIDFKEMACGISACCRGPLAERQKFCFKVFDQDCDGMLSQKEVYHMIESLMFVKQENRLPGEQVLVSRKEVEEVVNEILEKYDTNRDGTITLDEYLVWTVGQTLPLDFLNLLFQVCHLVLGLRPSREEEGEIIRCWLDREERRGIQVGQFWYLISMDWWRSWNEYVDYQSDSALQPISSLKRSNRLQRKIDSSVARSSLDDSSSNVVLSSIISYGEDVVATLHSENSNGSLCGNSCSGLSGSVDSPSQQSQGIPKKSLNVQTLEPPKGVVTPGHSPVAARRSGNGLPQRPPSIDNSSLIVPNTLKAMILTGEGGKLKRNAILTRGRDFEIVPEAVWRALSQWYGGSPALPRQVILPYGSDAPEFELYPITLKLFRHQNTNVRQPANTWSGVVGSVASAYGGNTTSYALQAVTPPKKYLAAIASFSRMATLKQVFDFLCIRLRLRPEDTRLWLYKDDNNLSPLEEEDMTLEQLGIEDYEQVLVEVRNKDQTWPEEMSSLLYARADQKNQGPTERGATGLNNLGNTCFMNAALQCVSNTRGLTLYFINNKHLYELNRMNPLGMKGHIAKRYGDLVHELWSGTSRTIAPLKLRWTIGKYAPRFNGFQQHDSQELLAFLMDGLHEDLNRVHEKPYVELKDSDGRPDEEVAKEAWENHVLRNRSIIVDLFHGQLQSTVTCMVCGHASVHFDPFNYLSLPLPMESCVHVEVVVFRLDGSIPVKYGLRLNHDDRYLNLKQQLGELCRLAPQQLLVAEVSGSVIKTLPCDDHKIRSSIAGPLFAYELPLNQENGNRDEPRSLIPREQHSLNQIQRMPLSAISCRKQVPSSNAANEDAQKNTSCNNSSSASSSSISTETGEGDKPVFKVGDSGGDSWNSSTSSQVNMSGEPPSLGSLSSYGQSSGQWNLVPPNGIIGISSGPSSMTSSLISNTSTVDLTETGNRNIVVVYHRKMIRQDVYFMSSQKTRPTVFGLPLILPCNAMTTHQDLYQMVWTQVARLLSPLPPTETAAPNHAQDCDDSLGYEYPFTLKAIQKDGLMCAWCPWYRFCRGCRIDCCNADFNFSSAYIAIDWDATALHLRYQSPQERVFLDHESVEKAQRQQTDPISLHDCLEAFTREEQLGEEEKYYCSKCKKHQLASKKLQIWRLPPVLIVHLKRFQLLNGRWVKSHKIVKFPFKDFDPSDYLAAIPHKAVRHSEVCGRKDAPDRRRSKSSNALSERSGSIGEGRRTASSPTGERIEAITVQPKSNSYNSTNNNNNNNINASVNAKNSANEQNSVNASPSRLVLENGIDAEEDATGVTNFPLISDVRVSASMQNGVTVGRCKRPSDASCEQTESNGLECKSNSCRQGNGCQVLQDFHQHKLQDRYHPFRLKYNLYALACHSGILGGGHYVSYACNPNNRWYCYNDSSCKEVQPDQIDADSAYMLFYEREGIDYESYLPNVEGKIPDTREIDDEFESDFRKMCCLQ